MEYEIVENINLVRMVEDVNNMVDEGWEPIGGVAVSTCEYRGYEEKTYLQAIIRKEK